MPVHWLIQAQDALQESLGDANRLARAYQDKVRELSGLLERTFPAADAVLVVDCLQGFSAGPARQVLRVEAIEEGMSRARIVKIGPPAELAAEYHGWQECRRPWADRGRVFMELVAGVPAGEAGLRTLVYEDAQQTLRAAETMLLESAVLNACRWGTPSAESLEGVWDQLFAELTDRLYALGAPAPLCGPESDPAFVNRLRLRLEKGLPHWRTPGTLAEQCRRVVLASLPGETVEFFDPAEYLPRLFASGKHLPEVLRGPAHGDLHGRNVLVGIVEGQARLPAVFDYEHLARDNLPGWDFVKLEMELKVRALQEVFVGDEAQFVQAVYRFERSLAEQTERCNNMTAWPRSPVPDTPQARLEFQILALRRQAKRCLETLQRRRRSWLHEYYFLLAVYGAYAGKFDNYHRRDLIAALLCSGFAAGRFAWAKAVADNEQKRATALAVNALAEGNATVRPAASALSHHGAFAFARRWVRSRQTPFVAAAVEILTQLRTEYRYLIEIGQELALGLLELSTLCDDRALADRAERLLLELDEQTPVVSMETLCRWGRRWKDRGDELSDRAGLADQEMSRQAYATALGYYQRAYDLCGRNYYPGINCAALQLLLGHKRPAARLAQAIVDDLDEGRRHRGDELAWVWATLAEGHLILGRVAQAAEYYRRAVAHRACQAHHVAAMRAQVERILRVQPCDGSHLASVFPS